MYGGLHLQAWNAPFVSRAEEILWRFSEVVVAYTGLIAISFFLVCGIELMDFDRWEALPD